MMDGHFHDPDGLRILVAEEHREIRAMIRSILKHADRGVRIDEAADTQTALDMLTAVEPDLLITDWTPGGVDGRALLRALRDPAGSVNPYMPVVLVTGRATPERIRAARDAGVNEIVAKPFSAATLTDRVLAAVRTPRPFVRAEGYFGPDRRRRQDGAYHDGAERRQPAAVAPRSVRRTTMFGKPRSFVELAPA